MLIPALLGSSLSPRQAIIFRLAYSSSFPESFLPVAAACKLFSDFFSVACGLSFVYGGYLWNSSPSSLARPIVRFRRFLIKPPFLPPPFILFYF